MKSVNHATRCVSIGAAFGLIVCNAITAKLFAQDTGCQPVANAMVKLATTPRHSYTTDNSSGKASSSELITTNDSMFIKVDGKWVSRPYSPQKEKKHQQEVWQKTKATCQHVSDEAVSGETAVVFNVLNKTEYGTSNQKLWISTSKGLPLRAEIDPDTDDKASTRHISMHYDYANVQPPAAK